MAREISTEEEEIRVVVETHGRGTVDTAVDLVKRDRTSTWDELLEEWYTEFEPPVDKPAKNGDGGAAKDAEVP